MNKETTKELQLLIEFTESMEKSIETMQKVTSEQCDLKNLVVLHDEEHRLDEFSRSLSESISNMNEQMYELHHRLDKLKDVINKCESSDEVVLIISDLLAGLGVFGKCEN